ncbi:MIP/aquaporin family protein [Mycobacterium sp. SMC-4]|uniref:MIP/aquaporin family protein n=1 Tax=Mycobacterium sp. SMC-4 TaxID=2857059 RepID=UPI003CFEAC8E
MSSVGIMVSEFLGTAVLVLIGNGTVAATMLKGSLAKGSGGDWLIIVIGWGFGVFAGASVADGSGGHINPVVTSALAITGAVSWSAVPLYFAGQLAGGIVGATLCWCAFKLQFDHNDNNDSTRAVFCTVPGLRNLRWNLVTEAIATFVLVLWILMNPSTNGSLGYAAVAFVVIAIGFGLGGPTGYAINPARDLGPRIAYALLPIPGKGTTDWGYAWVPIVGPVIGSTLAAVVAAGLS